MNILAVIPARAGSKGIPNKNLRLIAGHPLIYYSIQNAKSSMYITDIVVSTDSPDIALLAKQMGVSVRWRLPELCRDDVPLDPVIYDAVPSDNRYDYIITMQPTSPTLSTITLDHAIEYMIKNEYDTVVSVINKPHLSWHMQDGRAVPNYTERLNRQYLPPCYFETGAFVISKFEVVTQSTRFGKNVSVYEISEEEAVDIDSFGDLRVAEMFLNDNRIAMYVNGNNKLGMGHIYRILEVADEFYTKPDIYYDINQTDMSVFGNTTHNVIPVNGIKDLYNICREKQYKFFVNDILDTSMGYMSGLRSALPKARIVNFEDEGNGSASADLVINALLNNKTMSNMFVGEKYYIPRKIMMFYSPIEIRENVSRVFISFGGADPQNYSDRLLWIISKPEYSKYEFVVVLGRAKRNVESLLNYNNKPNIEVLHDVSNMPELMSGCDLAITSRGRTAYELAMLGIPTIAMAQNRREETHGFICNENGFTYIGLNPSDEIIEGSLKMYLSLSTKSRADFQQLLLSHDLRNGRKRVMQLINNL